MEGKFWSKFQCANKDGSRCDFTVRDCTERIEDVIELYYKYFKDEAILRLSGIALTEEAQINPLLAIMLRDERNHIAICVEESSGIVVGASTIKLIVGPDHKVPNIEPQTEGVKKLFQILGGMNELYDFYKNHSIEKWYGGKGVIVHPDYRRFGIGSALIQSRRKICKEHGVPITSAWMTSIATQKAAERDGWETVFEIDSRDFAKRFDAKPFEGIAPTFKVMVGKP